MIRSIDGQDLVIETLHSPLPAKVFGSRSWQPILMTS
jgi:hypothetical protein